MKPVRIQPRAEAEAEAAATWYEAEQEGLGVEFLLELDLAIERAAEDPLAYARVFMQARRVLTRRFPYAVYFLYENDAVEVVAVLHQHRATSVWQSRISR